MPFIILFLFYIGLALIVGSVGSNRKIGFFSAFIFALLLSPLIGWLITLAYPKEVNTKDPVYNDNLHFAMKAYHKGNMGEAYDRVNKAILRAPKEPEAYLRLGAFYAKDNNLEMAIKNVAKAKSLGVKSLELLEKEPFDNIRSSEEWIAFKANDYEINNEVNYNSVSTTDELMKLAELLEKGLLTKEEFEIEKKKLLN